MSLLDQINNKKRHLIKTRTVVTCTDGKRYVQEEGLRVELEPSAGYVVDTMPDNVPAHIVDGIYLGSQDCCELSVLTQYNIKFVLSVGIHAPLVLNSITYKYAECLDLPETNIIDVLNECIGFIEAAVGSRANLLIHCNAGVSRSASIVIGFLMLTRGMSYQVAYDLVKTSRPCIKPNVGFEAQLKAL